MRKNYLIQLTLSNSLNASLYSTNSSSLIPSKVTSAVRFWFFHLLKSDNLRVDMLGESRFSRLRFSRIFNFFRPIQGCLLVGLFCRHSLVAWAAGKWTLAVQTPPLELPAAKCCDLFVVRDTVVVVISLWFLCWEPFFSFEAWNAQQWISQTIVWTEA